ncbi:MAG: selenocysteine-specific translation elongation factor [Acidobacteria bacterium]|nr:selenocysteine-specific translation elongation factor [Acidobacteriota bacterium]
MNPQKQVIIGTAGHIDHGKTTLVYRMTGTDADRWEEEKRRGITIDIGFAHLEREGLALSFIDVPGHKDFVTNMLAGVHSVDMGLLVVAADESVMPQTEEHFNILKLLGVSLIIPVITKIDLADTEMVAFTELEIRELFQKNGLNEPDAIFHVSGTTGEGMDSLTHFLFQLGKTIHNENDHQPAHLHVDRSFTIKGHGTVITGTLMSGSLKTGDKITVYPSGKTSVIKKLNNHGHDISEIHARKRVALNVPQFQKNELIRGMVAIAEPLYIATRFADARIRIISGGVDMEDLTRIRVSMGSEDVVARIKLVEAPSEKIPCDVLCQLRFEREVACFMGERFIVRSYSPVHTIGGGIILDSRPGKRRGFHPASTGLKLKDSEDDRSRLMGILTESGKVDSENARARLFLTRQVFETVVQSLTSEKHLVKFEKDSQLYHPDQVKEIEDEILSRVEEFHRENPRKDGYPAGILRHYPESIVRAMVKQGQLVQKGSVIRLPSFSRTYSPDEQAAYQKLLSLLKAAGMTPPLLSALKREFEDGALLTDLLQRGISEGCFVRISSDYFLDTDEYEKFLEHFRDWAAGLGSFGIQEAKAEFGLVRKYLIPLLEHLDGEKITAKMDDKRKLL